MLSHLKKPNVFQMVLIAFLNQIVILIQKKKLVMEEEQMENVSSYNNRIPQPEFVKSLSHVIKLVSMFLLVNQDLMLVFLIQVQME